MIGTFVATLMLSIPQAVGVGVVISLLLQLNQEALDLRVVELVPQPGGSFEERPAPDRLASHSVTLLDVYGSLFYAGARTLQARLPEVGAAVQPAVVLRLRGRTMLGATAFKVFSDYSQTLRAAHGKLYLSGVDSASSSSSHTPGTSKSPVRSRWWRPRPTWGSRVSPHITRPKPG